MSDDNDHMLYIYSLFFYVFPFFIQSLGQEKSIQGGSGVLFFSPQKEYPGILV